MRRAEDERLNPRRMAERELLGDHAAEREAVDVDPVDREVVENRDGVVRHRLGRVRVRERLRLPDPAMVEGDHAHRRARARQRFATSAPAEAEAVDQQDGIAGAGALPVEPRPPVQPSTMPDPELTRPGSSARSTVAWRRCLASGRRTSARTDSHRLDFDRASDAQLGVRQTRRIADLVRVDAGRGSPHGIRTACRRSRPRPPRDRAHLRE